MTVAEVIRLIMDLRRQGISDAGVLNAMERVPRHLFMSESLRLRAYENCALPLICGQTISQPFVVAYMTTQLAVSDRMTVLEIGTGSGYQTAVLSHLARRVYSMERFPSLSRAASACLADLGLTNITLRVGDGIHGWREGAPFDRILLTACVHTMPTELTQQLKPGGILVMPLGDSFDSQRLVKVENTETGLQSTDLIPVRFVPVLEGIADKSEEQAYYKLGKDR